MRRTGLIVLAVLVATIGCGRRKSSLLLERQARGPIEEEASVAGEARWSLESPTQTLTQENITVLVTHASPEYLANFFSRKEVFGAYAGLNPYYPEHLVFYVKIVNQNTSRIRINPSEFVLIDDRGNQYGTIGKDYVTAYAEFRQPVSTVTRGVLESASPGYFGFSVPVGKLIGGKSQNRVALLEQSSLQSGFLYPGVVHDGLIAFWNPAATVKRFRLLITNVKTAFDPNDEPTASLEFPFEFTAAPR